MTRSFRWAALTAATALALALLPASPAAAAAPGNDSFATATTVSALPFAASGTLAEATTQAGEPDSCTFTHDDMTSHSTTSLQTVWYRYVSPKAQTLTFSGQRSAETWVVTAYQGYDLGSLQQLACASDWYGPLQGSIQASAGATYFFQVALDERGAPGGSAFGFDLSASAAAPNTTWSGALPIALGTTTATTTPGVTEPVFPYVGCDDASYLTRSLWYRFTPAVSGTVQVDVRSSDFDATFDVMSWNGGSPSATVACPPVNTNVGGDFPSYDKTKAVAAFQAVAGSSYAIQAGGYLGDSGTLRLTLSTVGTISGTNPTITGSVAVGRTLTANPGTWGPAPVSLSYQWKRGGTALVGADSATYVLTPADLGSRISVAVTGTRTGYTPLTKGSASTTAVVAGPLTAPTPVITGTAAVGQKLSTAPGWGPGAVSYRYQWKRNGSALTGATAASYTPVAADAGASITVTVTGSSVGYVTATKTSAARIIAKGTLTGPAPTITGTTRVGQILTAKPGTWAPAPVTLAYQWYRGTTAISGATAATYKLVTADKGASITVKVTGTKTGYTTLTKGSTAIRPS